MAYMIVADQSNRKPSSALIRALYNTPIRRVDHGSFGGFQKPGAPKADSNILIMLLIVETPGEGPVILGKPYIESYS